MVLRQAGPEWRPDRPLAEQSGWGEHAAFMDALVDDGFVVLGGPRRRPRRARDRGRVEADVHARLVTDRWNGSHLLVEAVKPWRIRLDGTNRR